ncbi:MAG: hypothetical protein HY761_03215 [Candidatus Omnitrophica bacterium]|nr:hypothetical protein [Candidatus Omnitrophota bacterium]
MAKVRCKDCGKTGYTASPKYIICSCGGRFRIIPGACRMQRAEPDIVNTVLMSFQILSHYA